MQRLGGNRQIHGLACRCDASMALKLPGPSKSKAAVAILQCPPLRPGSALPLLLTSSPLSALACCRFEGLTRDAVPHGMGVMVFGNGTGGGFHFRDVRRADK